MSKDEIGLDVAGLAKASGTLRNRKTEAQRATKLMHEGLEGAVQLLGPLKGKGSNFVSSKIAGYVRNIPVEVENAGTTGHNTAATARAADEEGARKVKGSTDTQLGLNRPINHHLPE